MGYQGQGCFITAGDSVQVISNLLGRFGGTEALSEKLGGFVAPNFSLGAVMLMHLARIAAKTGGDYSKLEDVPLDGWLSRLPSEQLSEMVVSRRQVWASSAWLWMLCSLLGLEWFLGRRRGLP